MQCHVSVQLKVFLKGDSNAHDFTVNHVRILHQNNNFIAHLCIKYNGIKCDSCIIIIDIKFQSNPSVIIIMSSMFDMLLIH